MGLALPVLVRGHARHRISPRRPAPKLPAAALLFWWAVLQGRNAAINYGLAVLFMLRTAIHSGLLGALITFARTEWHPAYIGRTDAWGLTVSRTSSSAA